MKKILVVAVLFAGLVHAQAHAQAQSQAQSQVSSDGLDRTPLEATTAKGEKVLLYPTGKWAFVDAARAAEASKLAEQFPENKVRPVDAQGGWVPGSKTLMPGDKDYNRGSLGRK